MFVSPCVAQDAVRASSSSNGCRCSFYRINDAWGIKLYESERIRDNTYKNQKRASEYVRFNCNHGYGPKVGNCFTVEIDGRKMFGYVTECAAATILEMCPELSVFTYIHEREELSEFVDVRDEMAINDMLMRDNHIANWAYMPDGTPICIDFDRINTDNGSYCNGSESNPPDSYDVDNNSSQF